MKSSNQKNVAFWAADPGSGVKMSVKSLFAIASLIAIAAVIAIAYIVLPERIWSATSIAALLLFGAAVGFALYAPFSLPSGNKGGDAAPMASIGPMGVIVTGLLGWSAITFVVALTGRESVTWAMMIVAAAGFLISNFILHAAAKIADQAAAETARPSVRTLWRGQLECLMPATRDANVRASLVRLVEKVSYASSGAAGSVNAVDDQITAAIAAAHELCTSNFHDTEQIQHLIARTEVLLDQRESQLCAIRSKA